MKSIFNTLYKLMEKYRLYLEGITEVAERFESDGTIIGAEQIIDKTCSELRNLYDAILFLHDIADTFSVSYCRFKVVEVTDNLNSIRFINYIDAINMLKKYSEPYS